MNASATLGRASVRSMKALIDNPETASDNDIAAERIRVAEAYLACKRRHADLVVFVNGY